MADGAEIDGVEFLQFIGGVRRQDFTGAEVTVTAPVEIGEVEGKSLDGGDGLQYFYAFADNFRPGAVTTDDGDIVCF